MKRLIVLASLAFALAATLAALTTGWALIEAVPGYRLGVLWLLPETLDMRLSALIDVNRVSEAIVYQSVHVAGAALIAAMTCVGIIRPLLAPSEPIAHFRSTTIVLGGTAVLIPLAIWSRPIMEIASTIPSPTNTLSSMPAYWYLGLILSAAIIATHMGLVAHDVSHWLRTRFGPPFAPEAPSGPSQLAV
ncbi:MAG: hypothetical protein WCH83_02040 [Alphaproteobacteria bacterium]